MKLLCSILIFSIMICSYQSISRQSNQCSKVIGGVRKSYAIDYSDIRSITVVDGSITAIDLYGGASFSKFVPDDDNTAIYTQESSRNGIGLRITQRCSLKFTGATSDKVVIANKAKGVLKGLWLHVFNDGSIHSQGCEYDYDGDGAIKSVVSAKVNPSVNSNTGEESGNVFINIESISTDLLPVSLTEEFLDSLVGVAEEEITPPSIILTIDGFYINATIDNGGDDGATVSIEITNNLASSSFGYGDLPYDIRDLCQFSGGGWINGFYDINATITNSVGSDSDSIIDGIYKLTTTINGYDCPTPPIITINPPVANMLPEPTINDGCGCGLATVYHEIELGLSTISVTSFPYDLMNLCGMGVDYSWRTSIELTTYAEANNLLGGTFESAVVATVEFAPENVNPPYIIISVNGVSC